MSGAGSGAGSASGSGSGIGTGAGFTSAGGNGEGRRSRSGTTGTAPYQTFNPTAAQMSRVFSGGVAWANDVPSMMSSTSTTTANRGGRRAENMSPPGGGVQRPIPRLLASPFSLPVEGPVPAPLPAPAPSPGPAYGSGLGVGSRRRAGTYSPSHESGDRRTLPNRERTMSDGSSGTGTGSTSGRSSPLAFDEAVGRIPGAGVGGTGRGSVLPFVANAYLPNGNANGNGGGVGHGGRAGFGLTMSAMVPPSSESRSRSGTTANTQTQLHPPLSAGPHSSRLPLNPSPIPHLRAEQQHQDATRLSAAQAQARKIFFIERSPPGEERFIESVSGGEGGGGSSASASSDAMTGSIGAVSTQQQQQAALFGPPPPSVPVAVPTLPVGGNGDVDGRSPAMSPGQLMHDAEAGLAEPITNPSPSPAPRVSKSRRQSNAEGVPQAVSPLDPSETAAVTEVPIQAPPPALAVAESGDKSMNTPISMSVNQLGPGELVVSFPLCVLLSFGLGAP